MCGRYAFVIPLRQARARLAALNLPVAVGAQPVQNNPDDDQDADQDQDANQDADAYDPAIHLSHNICPGYTEPILLASSSLSPSSSSPSPYTLQPMRWGLVPSWSKTPPSYGSLLKTINCRSETLAASNSGLWNSVKHRKRCVVLAQGFFEWLHIGKEKLPYFVRRKDGDAEGGWLMLAGLWDEWRPKTTKDTKTKKSAQNEDSDSEEDTTAPLHTFTIITTASNPQLKFLHNRMPVILSAEDVPKWLDPSTERWNSELQGLLKPFAGELECYRVPREVGKVGNDEERFVKPLDLKEEEKGGGKGGIMEAFARGKLKEERKEAKGEVKQGWKGIEGQDQQATPKKHALEAEPEEAPASPRKSRKLTSPAATSAAGSPTKKGKHSAITNTKAKKIVQPKTREKGNQKITSFFGK